MFSLFSQTLTAEQKKILLLSSMGGLLEFYDFTIYGLFAVYFAHQFFPTENHFISVIATYSVFVMGYIVRPLGGILFSHIGDEIGRKIVLILTMLLMGIASFGMGLLPTYAQIGIWAPVLMLLFRLLQGLAIGGELPSMIVYVAESMPKQRGFGMGCIFSGTVSGLIPGMLLNLVIVHMLTSEQITSFGWRIPFILGGILCFIAYRIRRELHETKAFTQLKCHERAPFFELLRHHSSSLFIGIALVSVMAMSIILLIIFMPTYLTTFVKINPKEISGAILMATLLSVCSTYGIGVLSDRYDCHKIMKQSLICLMLAATACYYLMSMHIHLMLALALFAIPQGCVITLVVRFLSELFPTEIRLTGVALAYNISFVLFAGLSPIVITSLIEKTGLLYLTPLICLFFSISLAGWGLHQINRRRRVKLQGSSLFMEKS